MNLSVGLVFNITPKFNLEKGQFIESLNVKKQQEGLKNELIRNVKLDVKNYFNQIIYYKNSVHFSKQAVDYNETAISNEYTKLKLGTSTVINVVQLQNNYATALKNYYNGLRNLYMAIAYFRFNTGTLIKIIDEKTFTVDTKLVFTLPIINL